MPRRGWSVLDSGLSWNTNSYNMHAQHIYYLYCSLPCSATQWREEKSSHSSFATPLERGVWGTSELRLLSWLSVSVERRIVHNPGLYSKQKKILIVCYTAKLFISSFFPCKKLREETEQGRNVKGTFPWAYHIDSTIWGAAWLLYDPPTPTGEFRKQKPCLNKDNLGKAHGSS